MEISKSSAPSVRDMRREVFFFFFGGGGEGGGGCFLGGIFFFKKNMVDVENCRRFKLILCDKLSKVKKKKKNC